jgi:hypothetical protein
VPAATTRTGTRAASRPARDAVLVGAVDLARSAAELEAEHPSDVGEHVGATVDGDRLVTHRFACTMRGYSGWCWTVTLSRVPRARTATVCEVALLPGDDALLAPAWLPWSDRLRPGDVGPGDVLPFLPDDPRLVPGYVPAEGGRGEDEDEDQTVAIEELALARVRVLGPLGRDEAAERWYRGPHGPATSGSVAAAAECASCAFLVPLQGSLGQVFGVCANAWSSDDGSVVSLDHGCGAHSETDAPAHPTDWPAPEPLIDELVIDVERTEQAGAVDQAGAVAHVAADAEPAADAAEAAPES